MNPAKNTKAESKSTTAKAVTPKSAKSTTKTIMSKSAPKAESTAQLHIDKEALSSLALVQEGLLSPISKLADAASLQSTDPYLTPFTLNPAGKKNQEVLKRAKSGEKLDIVLDSKIVGSLHVKEVFGIDRRARAMNLANADSGEEFERIYARLGDYGVCGDYRVDFPDISQAKATLNAKIKAHKAKTITGIMLDGQIFHRAHEKLIRDTLGDSDLVVVFLLKPYTKSFISYELQRRCLDFATKNFLLNERICIIPLDDTYLFMGTNKVLLRAIVAKNYGCTHFIVSQSTPNLSMFYDNHAPHSMLDNIKDIRATIKGAYVYCNVCKMLVNHQTCPHGKHHHISYDAESILEFFRAGLLPPAILVRPRISAMILAHLVPNRFKNLQKLYYDLIPSNEGILLHKSEEEFYTELMRLYQTTSLT